MNNLRIPDAALDDDIAIIAKKGRGKTYAAKGIAERLHALGRRFCVMDPLDSWWGLKANADGSPGLPVIVVGGEHGDVPLNPDLGEEYGRFVATSDASVVFCIGELTRGAMIRFSTAFFKELYRVNKAPLTLFLEEGDVFAPQQPMGDATVLLHHVDQIARRGRGLRLVTLTQRPAKLHKDVLTQLSTLVVLGISSPQDRAAVQAWVEGNADRGQAKAVVDSLASLKVGEGWVWSPDHDFLYRGHFPKNVTLDTSATPKAGDKKVKFTLAKPDVSALIEAVKIKEPEPASAKEKKPSADEIKAAEARGYLRGYEEGHTIGRYAGKMEAAVDMSRLASEIAEEAATESASCVAKFEAGGQSLPTTKVEEPIRIPARPGDAKIALLSEHRKPPPSPSPAPPAADGAAPVSGPQQRILNALAWLRGVRINDPKREIIAFLADASPKSSAFVNNLGYLRTSGLVDYPAGVRVELTAAGMARAEVERGGQPTDALLQERIFSKLEMPKVRILKALLDRHPEAMRREDLAEAAGASVTSSAFVNNLGNLHNSWGLITYPGKGMVGLSDLMFVRAS